MRSKMRLEKPLVIDRAKGITPTVAGWDTDPTNLANITDGDWTTVTGWGATNKAGAGYFGYVKIDLGAVYSCLWTMKVGVKSAANKITGQWQWSTDGITYYSVCDLWPLGSQNVAERIQYVGSKAVVRARYVHFAFYVSGAANTADARIYAIQAHDLIAVGGKN
jgi:hypothetical protein